MIWLASPTTCASREIETPYSHSGPVKPGAQVQTVQRLSITPPFWHVAAHTAQVGPVRKVRAQLQVQLASSVDALLHWGLLGQWFEGVMSMAYRGPVSMPMMSTPRRRRPKPPSPQVAPHEFWIVQYGTPASAPQPIRLTECQPMLLDPLV